MKQADRHLRVWDPSLRLFHWLLGLAFVTAYAVGDERLHLHVLAGSTMIGLLLYRVLWGCMGPHYARWRDVVRSPRAVGRHLCQLLRGRSERHVGHTPAGGAMILVLILMLAILAGTGLLLDGAEAGSGPFAGVFGFWDGMSLARLADVHAALADAMVVLIALHVGGVLLESLLHRENLVLAMITGRKRPNAEENI